MGLHLLGLVAALSLITFAAFAIDKWRAKRDLYRIPEKTLLALAALGGSPGAVLGQRLLRHKTVKEPFRTYLRAIIIAQLGLAVVFGVIAVRQAIR